MVILIVVKEMWLPVILVMLWGIHYTGSLTDLLKSNILVRILNNILKTSLHAFLNSLAENPINDSSTWNQKKAMHIIVWWSTKYFNSANDYSIRILFTNKDHVQNCPSATSHLYRLICSQQIIGRGTCYTQEYSSCKKQNEYLVWANRL